MEKEPKKIQPLIREIRLKLIPEPFSDTKLKEWQQGFQEMLGKEICGDTLYSILYMATKLKHEYGLRIAIVDPQTKLTWKQTNSRTGWGIIAEMEGYTYGLDNKKIRA